MSIAEKRYAKAMVELAFSRNIQDAVKEELSFFKSLFEANEDLKLFLINPCIPKKDKKSLIYSVFKDVMKNETVSFLQLLLDKNRIGLIQGICAEYKSFYDRKVSILEIKIISALQLDKEQIKNIEEKMKKQLNASRIYSVVTVDPSLIGGLMVIAGDKVFDASVRGRLNGIKKAINELI